MKNQDQPYHTVRGFGEGEHTVDRSRFIGRALYVETEEEAAAYIEEVKAEHYDARHVCYAFRIGRGADTIDRSNDDGEPARTAGLPMWQVLEGRELTDTLVVVIRYYGGIKLGMGGLARAYREAARIALDEAGVVERFPSENLTLRVPYGMHGKVQYLFDEFDGVTVRETEFTDLITLHCKIHRIKVDDLRQRLAALLQEEPAQVFVEDDRGKA